MTDHTVDPKLLSQIEELRQLLARSLQLHPHLAARCVALTQRLDQVALQLRQAPTDESSAWRALAEIGEALAQAERAAPPSPTFDLLRETLPPQPRRDAQLANQARLVQHLSSQPHTLDAAQSALRDYAEQRPLASQSLPDPAALQQSLSAQLAAAPAASVGESRLVSLADLPKLQQALAAAAPLSGLDPAQPHLPSSGDLQRDLRALADRYLTSTPHAASTEDLVLARIEADPQGNIRGVHLHPIQALSKVTAAPQAAALQAAPASPAQEAAHSALHTQAAVDLLRRRVTEMRRDLSADRADAADAQAALATEQRRLATLEALAADAQQRLNALAADAQQRDAAEQAVAATRDAASRSLQQHTGQLAQTAQSFIQSLQSQAQQTAGTDRQALLALRDSVDQWLQSPTLQRPTPEALQQHAATLQGLISQSHSAAPAAAQPLLSHLASQAADARDRAAVVATALAWSPLAPAPAPAEAASAQASEAELHAARSLVASHAARFQRSAYAAATTEDRLLAVEQPFASFLRDLPPTTRAPFTSLDAPSAQAPAAPVSSLNLSAITAQSAALLQQLKGLPQGAEAAPSVNLYTEAAGLELPRAASAALSTSGTIAEASVEMVDRSLQRALFALGESTRQAQQLAASAAHLAATRSGQRDLGMRDGFSPLFKRKVGVSQEGKVGDVFLPALRAVSGLGPVPEVAGASAGERGELAVGQREEAQALQAKQSSLMGALERVFQQLLPSGQTAALVSDAVQSASGAQRALSRFEQAAAARARAPQSGVTDAQRAHALEAQELTKALRAEAQSVPMDVASKLGPVTDEVGVDFSSIRLYNGPRAAQLADAMGAHAFAMGKHIFGRMDLGSVQGLGVLAHEATHTTHYNDPTSVAQKEQEAEAIERKAVQHLSGGRYELALEPPNSSLKRDGALRASGVRGLLDAAAPNPNNLMDTLSTGGDASHGVIARVAEVIMKRMKRELTTDAERVGNRPL